MVAGVVLARGSCENWKGEGMNRPKVIMKIIRNCHECPHSSYDSGGAAICHSTGRDYLHSDGRDKIQPFCPLDDAPASIS